MQDDDRPKTGGPDCPVPSELFIGGPFKIGATIVGWPERFLDEGGQKLPGWRDGGVCPRCNHNRILTMCEDSGPGFNQQLNREYRNTTFCAACGAVIRCNYGGPTNARSA